MNNKKEESAVAEFLKTKGFRVEKIEEGQNSSPDFRVFKGDDFCFFCEVKTIAQRQPNCVLSAEEEFDINYMVAAGAGTPKYIPNRLVGDIYKAVKQFDAVNPNLKDFNVLAFVNHGRDEINDLREVITGSVLVNNDGRRELLEISAKYSEGLIREKKKRIHLYLWFDAAERPRFLFKDKKSPLKRYFGFEENA